ncbi:MAG: M23 family metallopeptidase [Proteobacteria bacterium]|nr:M23 family metallopeptidase [Pseudomonadota bacterium]MBU1740531.1 M23 family metallopeptidase [Pseudomonadota bacterium]
MARRYTVVLVPNKIGRIKKFQLPPFLLTAVILLIFSLAGLSAFLWWQIDRAGLPALSLANHQLADLPQVLARERSKNVRLRNENLSLRIQIQRFATEIKAFQFEMSRLARFDRKLRIMANLDTKNPQGGLLGVGGPGSSGLISAFEPSAPSQAGMIRGMHRQLASLRTDVRVQQLSQKALLRFLKKQRTILASTPSIWPTRGWVTSGFGYRRSPYTGGQSFHSGIDIANRPGTAVVATANGVVVKAGYESGYGTCVLIKHGHRLSTKFAHMQKTVVVKVGDRVRRGQKIGFLGMTGRTTGPHLHYEVRLGGVPVNPRRYLLD